MTLYVVLTEVKDTGGGVWLELGEQNGTSDLDAIKKFLTLSEGKHGAGTYRAVPRRSWPQEPHKLEPKISFV